jgi:hypothetical protein
VERNVKMANKFYRDALILIALGGLVNVPMLSAEPPVGSVRYAIMHAKEAVTMAHRVMLRRS